jgi:hypothetical protein
MSLLRLRSAVIFAAAAVSVAVVVGANPCDARAGEAREQAGRLSRADFDSIRAQLGLHKQPWASVPWKVSVTEARELAARSRKPIFLVVNTGNCLGFV